MLKENLFLADGIPPFKNGGMETHAGAYIQYKGDKIVPYSFDIDKTTETQEIISRYNLSKVNFTLPFNSIYDSQILNSIIAKHSPEFVFFNSLFWIEIITQLKKTNNYIKFILRSGGNDISQSNIQNAPTLEERRAFVVNTINNSIDVLIVNSQFTFNIFLEYGICEDKMKVIVGGVDTNKFTPVSDEQKLLLREKLCISKEQTIGIAVSRLVEFKNIPAVLETAKNIVVNPNNMFILVGGGPLLNEARNFVKKNNLGNKILIIGDIPVQDIPEYYQIADYFLQMSTYSMISVPSTKKGGEYYFHTETMGRSAMEAMSSGLPIIATSVGGVPEVIKDGGILIPDNDVSEAVKSILEIMTNNDLSRILSHKAREIAIKKYSWDNVFNNYKF